MATNGVGPNINRGAGGLAADWILVAASCTVVTLRFYAKSVLVRKVGWDDALMALALLGAIGHAVVMTEAFHYYIVGPTSTIQRWTLYAIGVLQVVINTICVVMIYAQCGSHVSALWGAGTAQCLNPSVQTDYGYAQSGFNSLCDLVLTILPGIIVYKLQVKLSVKLGLAFVLCLSIFAFAASIVKTYQIHLLGLRGDLTWNFVDFVIWVALEINLVMICASTPTLRPIFKKKAVAASSPYYEMYGGPSARVTAGSRGIPIEPSSHSSSGKPTGRSMLTSISQEDILPPQPPADGVRRTYEVDVSSKVLESSDSSQSYQPHYKW